MTSSSTQRRDQPRQPTMNDGRILDKRMRQLLDSAESCSGHQAVDSDTLVRERTSDHQQRHRPLVSNFTASFDQFPSWSDHYEKHASSASVFCGESLKHTSAGHPTSYSLRSTHPRAHYRLSIQTQPDFDRSPLGLPTVLTTAEPRHQTLDELQRTLSSLSKRNARVSSATSYHPRLTNHPSDPFDIMSRRSSAVITKKATSTAFCYRPASDALVFDNLAGTCQSTTAASPRSTNSTSKTAAS